MVEGNSANPRRKGEEAHCAIVRAALPARRRAVNNNIMPGEKYAKLSRCWRAFPARKSAVHAAPWYRVSPLPGIRRITPPASKQTVRRRTAAFTYSSTVCQPAASPSIGSISHSSRRKRGTSAPPPPMRRVHVIVSTPAQTRPRAPLGGRIERSIGRSRIGWAAEP